MTIHLGTSGWQYADWRGRFYPQKLPQARWLEHYAERFGTVEVDNTFYRLPERSTFESWAQRTPAGFVIALKASRYLTHVRRLADPEGPVKLLMERVEGLGVKVGPILVQLPPTLRLEEARLEQTLASFPVRTRVAVEFRHESWFTDSVANILADHGAALCIPDRESKLLSPLWRTAEWTYIRFHEGRSQPTPCYGRRALESWVTRIASHWDASCDVYVYFNNDHRCCAVRNAREFAHIARRQGITVTRVPEEPIPV
ncbi:MAG TPA: DUF72 domain-containing protein [Candidatus Dormibacteraeota bacterium]|nr:DUF72 domain-containing protein [Candidatus Dormibacteraeota bacterium]